ncbi:MAG: glutathione S-transferase family protein, partial [Novosphingobium sp.]
RDYDFRVLSTDDPANCPNWKLVNAAGPQGQFPVLVDGANVIFEATCVIEYLDLHHPGERRLIPADADAALATRMMDRVFDNHLMNVMQRAVSEHLFKPQPDAEVMADVRRRLHRTYAWLEDWLAHYQQPADHLTLIECAAAPSLFYADWVEQVTDAYPRLKAWRAQLNAMPEVSRCIEAARPFRAFFPLGAPDRD